MWEVYEFLARGGPIMVPIALGSVTGLQFDHVPDAIRMVFPDLAE